MLPNSLLCGLTIILTCKVLENESSSSSKEIAKKLERKAKRKRNRGISKRKRNTSTFKALSTHFLTLTQATRERLSLRDASLPAAPKQALPEHTHSSAAHGEVQRADYDIPQPASHPCCRGFWERSARQRSPCR